MLQSVLRNYWDLLLLLVFRHSAKSLNPQEDCLATSPPLVTRFHQPHAIVVRLHVRKSNVFILTPETADIVGVLSSELSLSVGFSIQDEAPDVARSAPQGAHYNVNAIYLLT